MDRSSEPNSSSDQSLTLTEQIRQIAEKEQHLRPQIELERKVNALEYQIKGLKETRKQLADRNEELEDALLTYAGLHDQDRQDIGPLHLPSKRAKHRAIPLINWTDWHVAEVVEKDKVNGLNEFNPEIAERRVDTLTENTIKMIRAMSKRVKIDELFLQLGGDFITGYLHDELAQTNAMGPTEESYFALKLLERSVGNLIETLKLPKVRVVCIRGNHARGTGRKMQYKNDFETSYETFIYRVLADRLASDTVEFIIPRTDVVYTEVMPGLLLRSIHGHQVRYAGGVGGISIPLNKWIQRQDKTIRAAFTMMGHYHTDYQCNEFAISGALKGYDEYAASHGFPFEPPSQSFSLFDTKRLRVTAKYPIFCDNVS
jgi:hypothetical protein